MHWKKSGHAKVSQERAMVTAKAKDKKLASGSKGPVGIRVHALVVDSLSRYGGTCHIGDLSNEVRWGSKETGTCGKNFRDFLIARPGVFAVSGNTVSLIESATAGPLHGSIRRNGTAPTSQALSALDERICDAVGSGPYPLGDLATAARWGADTETRGQGLRDYLIARPHLFSLVILPSGLEAVLARAVTEESARVAIEEGDEDDDEDEEDDEDGDDEDVEGDADNAAAADLSLELESDQGGPARRNGVRKVADAGKRRERDSCGDASERVTETTSELPCSSQLASMRAREPSAKAANTSQQQRCHEAAARQWIAWQQTHSQAVAGLMWQPGAAPAACHQGFPQGFPPPPQPAPSFPMQPAFPPVQGGAGVPVVAPASSQPSPSTLVLTPAASAACCQWSPPSFPPPLRPAFPPGQLGAGVPAAAPASSQPSLAAVPAASAICSPSSPALSPDGAPPLARPAQVARPPVPTEQSAQPSELPGAGPSEKPTPSQPRPVSLLAALRQQASTHALSQGSAAPASQQQVPSEQPRRMTLPSGDSALVSFVADPRSASAMATRLGSFADETFVTLDAEGLEEGVCLLQLAFDAGSGLECYLVDVVSLADHLQSIVGPFLQSPNTLKFIHDVRMDAEALYKYFGISLAGVLDTQLMYELATGVVFGGLGDVLEWCGVAAHTSKSEVHRLMDNDTDLWRRRPLTKALESYAVQDVCLLHAALPRLQERMEEVPSSIRGEGRNVWDLLLQASSQRVAQAWAFGERRSVAFDPRLCHRLTSRELLEHAIGAENVQTQSSALAVQDEVQSLLQLVPEKYIEYLGQGNILRGAPPLHQLRDVILDLGARPRAFFGSRRLVFLCDDPTVTVTQEELDHALQRLEGKFGPDNRAGIDGSLHRISAMRCKTGEVYGLTLRVGRAVFGNTNMITDLLLEREQRSVLILGNPGCGKTTIVREAARVLSMEAYSVVVVDTSNEICGDGRVVHRSVGMSRRMVVPDISQQATVLIEAVQNHTPDVIVVDEIGRCPEVEAARTVKARGVRLIGSAHGNLPGLVRNGMLNGLVGGTETVLLGDAEAKRQQQQQQKQQKKAELSKVRTQRAGAPVFDIIVELQPGRFDEWRVVTKVAQAVDSILVGRPYLCQRRSRDASTGEVFLTLEKSDGSW